MGVIGKLIDRATVLFAGNSANRDTVHLVYLLLAVIGLAYVLPTLVLLSPSGTDVYTHMYSTQKMAESGSLLEFYDKSFNQEYLMYDYPFGMWFFGSIVMKVTGMGIQELSYVLPLVLLIASIFIYYVYAHQLLRSRDGSILATIFLLSIPLVTIGMLNYTTSRFVVVILVAAMYLSLNKPTFRNVIITYLLVFSLGFTHTGTYMFLMFFSISYFILSALIWKKFDSGMYILIVGLLVLYVIAVQLFPFVQPQYIDKGRMVLSVTESISSKLGLEEIQEMGRIFYERIFVANNFTYVIFWSSLIFAVGKLCLSIRSKLGGRANLLAIPVLSDIRNISHGITTAPFWLGPVHTLLSVFGVFKLDQRGKCIALSLAVSALFPGAMQSDEGTGALREIYYLYLIIPISSAAGFYYILPALNRYFGNKTKRTLSSVFVFLLILPLLAAPIIGNLYYQPTISGTSNEKESLTWLGTVGNPSEGAPEYAYRERIDLYANKLTPSIPQGSEMKRFMNDLKNIYFSSGAENYARDLYSFNIKYIISSERTLKGFRDVQDPLRIDSNKLLDKIYSSNDNFSIYRYISPPPLAKGPKTEDYGLKFEDNSPQVQDFGSVYAVENEFYKVKLSASSPRIRYIGTNANNMLGDGGFNDNIRISWSGSAYRDKYAYYNLGDLSYPQISVDGNEITYRTTVKDENNTENWATLVVKYIFYERTIQREVTVANDWVNLDSSEMGVALSSSIFAPVKGFDFHQIEYEGETSETKKIYPSQDAVILKDKKFNEIFFNTSDTGLFIKYSDLDPYPTKITYKGSTLYEYGGISTESSYSLSPGESAHMTQYMSVGDKSAARSNVLHYSSVFPYMYPEAKIPMIVTGYPGESSASDASLNAYEKLRENSVIYNEGIAPDSETTLQSGVTPLGYVTLYGKDAFKSPAEQRDELRKVKALGANGVSFKSFRYDLDTIKALSDSNLLFAQSLTVSSPLFEFFREGFRYPKLAYYRGEKTGVVLIPVTSPTSSLLRPEFDVDKLFSQWKETIDSVVDDGGMAVFWWNPADIGNPDYADKVMELVNYARKRGVSFTTTDAMAFHFKLIDKISTRVTEGIDYVVLNVTNHNGEDVKGVTFRLLLPVLSDSCPYYAVNGRIPRYEVKDGNCVVYTSLDLKRGETKLVTIGTNITRKKFDLDLSDIYEGYTTISVRDSAGAPVANASIYVDGVRIQSNSKGEAGTLIRRGVHRIVAEKPGFVSAEYEVIVKGRIYKLFDRLRQAQSNSTGLIGTG